MTPDRYAVLKDVFQRACEVPADQQAAFLDAACGDDAGLRAELDALLKEDRGARAAATFGTNEQVSQALPRVAPGPNDAGRVTAPRPADYVSLVQPPESAHLTPILDRPASSLVSHGRFTPGTLLMNRWRIVALLGEGGMGEVYRADDLKLGQAVALKFLSRKLQKDPGRLRDLYTEVRMARQVGHPNVCRVYDIDEVAGDHFISMEYVDGENLDSLLRRIGRLPQEKAVQMAHDLCAGLAAIHDQGMLHRDLKPGNVMVDGKGHAKISDFGLAILPRDQSLSGISGTPGYMPPEVLAGERATVKSDVYALGLVLYEMFTGKPAYEGQGVMELIELQRSVDPPSPSTVIDDLNPDISYVLQRCIDRVPDNRPPTPRAVSSMLPSGNALRVALAAGETPSPELVAAAGRAGGIPGKIGLSLASTIVLLLVAVIAMSGQALLMPRLPAGKAPEILEDRARSLVAELGYDTASVDSVCGVTLDEALLNELRAGEPSAARWQRLRNGRPAVLRFWYRQGPAAGAGQRPMSLVPTNPLTLAPTETDPPALMPGMIHVVMDFDSRLLEFGAVPEAAPPATQPATRAASEPSILFQAAGLEIDRFSKIDPLSLPPVFADERYAWEGPDPSDAALPVRVEAAYYGGRVVHFAVNFASTAPDEESLAMRGMDSAQHIDAVIGIVTLLGGGLLAYLNVRNGRGDRRGAFRLASFVFLANLVGGALAARYYRDFGVELGMLIGCLAISLYIGAQVWVFYIAIEPTVRRVWPEMMISWSRLLAGRYRDPLVSRDVLVGIVVGLLTVALLQVDVVLPTLFGGPLGRPVTPGGDLQALMGTRYAAATFFAILFLVVAYGLAMLLIVVLARIVFRREWIAATALGVLLTMLLALTGAHPILSWVIAALSATAVVLTLIHVGLLALCAALMTILMMLAFPVTSDMNAWYSGFGLFAVGLIVVVAALSLKNAVQRPRPGFEG